MFYNINFIQICILLAVSVIVPIVLKLCLIPDL